MLCLPKPWSLQSSLNGSWTSEKHDVFVSSNCFYYFSANVLWPYESAVELCAKHWRAALVSSICSATASFSDIFIFLSLTGRLLRSNKLNINMRLDSFKHRPHIQFLLLFICIFCCLIHVLVVIVIHSTSIVQLWANIYPPATLWNDLSMFSLHCSSWRRMWLYDATSWIRCIFVSFTLFFIYFPMYFPCCLPACLTMLQ